MKYGCPNSNCKFHHNNQCVVLDGKYFRSNDSSWIKRFKCLSCGKKFSAATFSSACRQKKRRVNEPLKNLLVSGVSMRRAARLLGVHQITVKRKLIFLANQARLSHQEFLKKFRESKIEHIQFDDLITSEHTKMKLLTVSLVVDKKKRHILAVEVGQIPAFGLLADKSRKKYGKRRSFHKQTLKKALLPLKEIISPETKFESDEHKLYPEVLKECFGDVIHIQHKGGRGCIAGQGELKKKHYDPLFILNHTCALLRGNINRLVRKTWCTTKDPVMLKNHLDIFVSFYNQDYLKS